MSSFVPCQMDIILIGNTTEKASMVLSEKEMYTGLSHVMSSFRSPASLLPVSGRESDRSGLSCTFVNEVGGKKTTFHATQTEVSTQYLLRPFNVNRF